jgi:hypothetical protein
MPRKEGVDSLGSLNLDAPPKNYRIIPLPGVEYTSILQSEETSQ